MAPLMQALGELEEFEKESKPMHRQRNIHLLHFIIVTLFLTSGCASISSPLREQSKDKLTPCSQKPRNLYLSSTKSDLIVATLPVSSFVLFNNCNSVSGYNCSIVGQTWIIAGPLSVIDTPFAFISDLYYLPSDYRHSKDRASCPEKSGISPDKSSRPPSTGAAKL